eukprot:768548-Hanusia_phi.AAC.6
MELRQLRGAEVCRAVYIVPQYMGLTSKNQTLFSDKTWINSPTDILSFPSAAGSTSATWRTLEEGGEKRSSPSTTRRARISSPEGIACSTYTRDLRSCLLCLELGDLLSSSDILALPLALGDDRISLHIIRPPARGWTRQQQEGGGQEERTRREGKREAFPFPSRPVQEGSATSQHTGSAGSMWTSRS